LFPQELFAVVLDNNKFISATPKCACRKRGLLDQMMISTALSGTQRIVCSILKH
jgi:hypothetical protein